MAELDDRYILAYQSARRTLKAELAYHEEQSASMFLPSAKKAEHARIAIRLSLEIMSLEEENARGWAKLSEVQGPSDAIVKRAEKLTADLAKVIVDATTADKILQSVAKFIDAWSKLADSQHT